jgi:hypothetical protein
VAGPPGIEDPISALFELSDRAAAMAPVVRRLYRYTAAILVVWIVIMAVVILIGLGTASWLSLLAFLGLLGGIIALGLLRQTDRFFREFAQRHRWIHLVREADPVVKVPEGRTPIERLGRYLASSNARVDAALKADPAALRYRVELRGAGRTVPFDLVLDVPGTGLGGRLGWGEPGFAIVARSGPDAPTVEDLRRLEGDALAVAGGLRGRLARLVLVRTQPIPLPEDVYEYAVGHPVLLPGGRGRGTLEIITENPDGTYDFVPHVLGVP